jgi:hypothetical protein
MFSCISHVGHRLLTGNCVALASQSATSHSTDCLRYVGYIRPRPLEGRGASPAARRPQPLIPASHYAPSHSAVGRRDVNIRFDHPMGAAILGPSIEYIFGDVTSGPNIDIRLKLYFKRDIYGFTPPYYTYSQITILSLQRVSS